MKKRILCLALTLALLLATVWILPVHAEGEILIPKAAGAVTLDGNIDDAEWDGAYIVDMTEKYKYSTENCVFKIMWDEDYFYIGYRGLYSGSFGTVTDYGGFFSGEGCTITVMDAVDAASYTKHICATPDLTNPQAAAEAYKNTAILMSFTSTEKYFPGNAARTVETDTYTLEVKIPFSIINLDGASTAAINDVFYMNINNMWAGFGDQSVTDGTATLTLVNSLPEPAPAGEIVEDGGELYYQEDGVGVMAGLVEVDGDLYFAGWNGKIVKNKVQNIWANATEDSTLTGKNRAFGADGKLLTGILNDVYYEDGAAKMAGLVEVDGDYYFAGWNGKIVKNKVQNIWANSTDNADLTETNQTFGADGKLVA